MRRSLIILAPLLALAGNAQGAIGETEQQIRAQYGEAVTVLPSTPRDTGLTKCYSAHGYVIAVTYLRGRSVREVHTKADNSKLSDTEIRALLNSNTGGYTWNAQQLHASPDASGGVRQWRSIDQPSRVAIYDGQTRALFITTQRFIDLTNAKSRQMATNLARRRLLELNSGPLKSMDAFGGGGFSQQQRNQAQPSGSPAK